MATLRQWLTQFEEHHGQIIGVRIGRKDGWYGETDEDYTTESGWPLVEGLVHLHEVPDAVLDKEFDSGYGSVGCPPVVAWSIRSVFCIDQYDGATSWFALSRDPRNIQDLPMPGG